MPVNIDLRASLNGFRESDKRCREIAVSRRSMIKSQPDAATDPPDKNLGNTNQLAFL